MSVDNSNLINNNNSVSSDLLYNLKNSAGTSRRYRANIAPNNGQTFSPGTQVNFSIPSGRRNTYLDGQNSYLRLTIRNNDGVAGMYLDNTGACFINMLTVNQSGNLIDQCPNYNLLFNYITDFSYDLGSHLGFLSGYLGTSATFSGTNDVTLSVAGSTIAAAANGATIGSVTSESFASGRQGYFIPASGTITVCLPLLCAIFLNSDKMIPLGKLRSDIEFIVLLETLIKSVATSSTTAWSVINTELVLEIVELSDTSQQIVDSFSPSDKPIYIHSNEWRYFSNSLPSGTTGNYTSLVSARYNSLKSIVCLPQLSSDIINKTSYSVSSRINPNIINYLWRVGSSIIPSKMVTLRNDNTTGGFAEAYVEVLKTFHGFNNTLYRPMIGSAEYNVWDQAASSTLGIGTKQTNLSGFFNGFAIAQELEVYSTRNDVILQGVNTIGQNIFFECNIDTTGPSAAYTLNFFANFDVILVIENGIMRMIP